MAKELRLPKLNQFTATGRLTKDFDYKKVGQAQTPACQTSIAIDDGYKDKNGNWVDRSYFVAVSAFGKSADYYSQYFHKGDAVLFTGKLVVNNYVDKDNANRSFTKIQLETMQNMEKRQSNSNYGNNREQDGNTDVPPPDDNDVPF